MTAHTLAKVISVTYLFLFIGDFLSTFFYHVPEHAFGKLHLKIHHSLRKDFQHYAVLSSHPFVLLDGLLGAIPYVLIAPALWQLSPTGTILGLVLGEIHVIWRHVTALSWQTPLWIQRVCHILFITTPEKHWLHHQNPTAAFGDIFFCFDQPEQKWLTFLRYARMRLKRWRRSTVVA